METYAKVFATMYTGSMYGAGMHIFAVWGWILAHKDENGLVEVNPEFVAHALGGVAQQVVDALAYLTAPDPQSRSKEHQGRRMVKLSQFGYQVVNHSDYQGRGHDRTAYWREYKRNMRERRKKAVLSTRPQASTVDNVDNCGMSTISTHANANADANADAKKKRRISSISSSEALRLADLLESLIRSRKGDFKRAGNWAKDIDLMIRLDSRQPSDVEAVIRWCQADGFWANNILSGAKLRKQYDQLDLKRRQVQPTVEDSSVTLQRLEDKGLL